MDTPAPSRPTRRRLGLTPALLLAALALGIAATAHPGDPALFPPGGGEAVTISLVASGWHSGLVLPRDALARAAAREGAGALLGVTERFGAYAALEVGWGDAGFYRQVPTLDALDWRLALAALFTPGGRSSVLHVVGIDGEPAARFPAARIVRLRLSPRGFARLAAALARSFRLRDGRPVEAGPGLYGPSLFYEAEGRFSLLRVCNHWSGELLHAAGLPVLPALHLLPVGLLLDLARQGIWPGRDVEAAPAGGRRG